MNWKISSFLPDLVQENFKVFFIQIIGFIYYIIDIFLCLKRKALIAGFLGSIAENLKEIQTKQANKSSQTEVYLILKNRSRN